MANSDSEYMKKYYSDHKEKIQKYMREYHQKRKGEQRLKNIWNSMRARCYNPKAISYKYYGAIGIGICDEWKNDFAAFERWSIENGYSGKLTIERLDNSKGYFPDNCKWATRKEQQNNTSYNHTITFNGQTHTLKQWSEITGISYYALFNRARRGWSAERMLSTPQKINYTRKEG